MRDYHSFLLNSITMFEVNNFKIHNMDPDPQFYFALYSFFRDYLSSEKFAVSQWKLKFAKNFNYLFNLLSWSLSLNI